MSPLSIPFPLHLPRKGRFPRPSRPRDSSRAQTDRTLVVPPTTLTMSDLSNFVKEKKNSFNWVRRKYCSSLNYRLRHDILRHVLILSDSESLRRNKTSESKRQTFDLHEKGWRVLPVPLPYSSGQESENASSVSHW